MPQKNISHVWHTLSSRHTNGWVSPLRPSPPTWHRMPNSFKKHNQGCRVGVETGVRVSLSRLLWPGLESLEIAYSDSGPESQTMSCQQTIILAEWLSILRWHWNIGKNKSSSTRVTLKRHFAIKFRLINAIGSIIDYLELINDHRDHCVNKIQSVTLTHSVEPSLRHGWLEQPSPCSRIGTVSLCACKEAMKREGGKLAKWHRPFRVINFSLGQHQSQYFQVGIGVRVTKKLAPNPEHNSW